ncbi:MAG: hypothetical protein H6867_10650 [Rhodospirillales bacterium]|nr:hypothetical protein [Rhodospirillales bacterium]MCB9995758.1 hypothetical protein [Rhodospirillales bacterium]
MEVRVANKKHVWHMVQRGILTQLHFDFEAYGLKTKFAQIMSYGDAIGDIAGNFVESDEIQVKRPDRFIPTPAALTVTRTSAHELDEEGRLPHRVAMAKIAQRFEQNSLAAAAFGVEEEGRNFSTVRKKGEDLYPKEKTETVVHYPLFDPDKKMQIGDNGEIVTDPPGMLKLNDKGQVVIGPEEKTILIPHEVEKTGESGELETVVEYRPMTPEDGAITFDVRIHPERGMIAYRFDEDPRSPYYENIENGYYEEDDRNDKWKFSEARKMISGYRIKWYDMAVLRPNLVRAGFHPSNIFFTHSRATITSKQKAKNYAVDTYSTVINTHLYGPQGEERLKLSDRTDPRTGETVPSAKLELVMKENTRYENKERGIRAGVFMPDGSVYDGRKGHKSPAYDAQASFAAFNYSRELAPNIVAQQELQADEDYLRNMLPGNNLTESHPPIFAMMRNSYPEKPVSDPMAFVGFDDQQGQLRRAIMMRLDLGDLRNFTYKGKTLQQMAEEDLTQSDHSQRNFVRMIKEQGRDPDSLIRIDSLRKFHGVVRLGEAMHTESATNWDLEQIDDNFRFLVDEENTRILEAVRDAVEVLNWEMREEPLPANPRLEEEWPFNSFGNLDLLEYEARQESVKTKNMPNKGRAPGVSEMLLERAQHIFEYHNAIDEGLHRLAIQPHPVDLYGYDDTLDKRAAVENYWELFNKIYKRFKDKNCPYIHIFDEYVNSSGKLVPPWRTSKEFDRYDDDRFDEIIQKIQDFRWDLMHRMLNDDELERKDKRSAYGKGLFDHQYTQKGRLLCGNMSRDFRVIDERGRELSINYIRRQYGHMPNLVQDKLKSKDWRIQFYRQESEPTTSVILMQFADMGKLNELDGLWKFRYEALRALYLHGAPNEDPRNMRWDAIPALERQLQAMEINQTMDDEGGLARVFSKHVSGEAEIFLRSEEGQRFLAEYKTYLDTIKAQYPPIEGSLQYDEETALPYDWIEHEIDADNYVMIDVPDTHLRKPLEDIRQSPYSLVIRALSEKDKTKIRRGTPVVLRGMQTGRLYHPGPVNVRQAPPESASYSDYFEQAQRAYKDDAGVSFPKPENRNILRVQEMIPIANVRPVDAAMQSLKVPSLYFDGLVSPRLAHFADDKPLTGLIMPADYCPQTLKAGAPIRFREMQADMDAKMEGTEGHETGHTYESKLLKVKRMTVGDLMDQVHNGEFTDEQARRCGYAGAYDVWEKVNAAFLNRGAPDLSREEILLLEFEPVDKKSWAYFNPPEAPKAAFIQDGKPVSPSAYRMIAGKLAGANDNDAASEVSQMPKPG